MRCVLIGNYGVSNVGDEALKEYFLTRFPEINWSVVSAHPEAGEYPRLPAGIRSLLTTPWWRTLGAIRRSDAVVFGGGSLFTDVESSFACFLWWLHAASARLFGVPVVLAFQGIGPFRTKRGEALARWVVGRCAFISVRDKESAERMAAWKMNSSCIQCADPIFILIQKAHLERAQKVIVLIPRHNADGAFFEQARTVIRSDAKALIRIVSMQPGDPSEQRVVERLRSMAGPGGKLANATDLPTLLGALRDATYVVSQRYHGAIMALALGIPVEILPQGTGDKLWALRELVREHPDTLADRLRSEALKGEAALKAWFQGGGA